MLLTAGMTLARECATRAFQRCTARRGRVSAGRIFAFRAYYDRPAFPPPPRVVHGARRIRSNFEISPYLLLIPRFANAKNVHRGVRFVIDRATGRLSIEFSVFFFQEKEKLEGELKRLEEISQERSVTAGNLRNELLTARDQLQALEAQMAKDREKFLKLREDKRILLDKVSPFPLALLSFSLDSFRDDESSLRAEACIGKRAPPSSSVYE